MSIRLHNTLTGKLENFVSLRPAHVGIYVCGPTVYDHAHMGHARSAVFFDFMARYFKFRGFSTTYVRNFTDIDDKIIERSRSLGLSPGELAEKYTISYREDMKLLGVLPPDFEPKVTEYIDTIRSTLAELIKEGYAYISDGNIWYRTRTQTDYGCLAGGPLAENVTAGFRVPLPKNKGNDRDFVLWKRTDDDAPAWESPWGRGRPGWHIQCVAMSHSLLGSIFDIHGGGQDLIFPHHENERVISKSLSGLDPARYWLHHGLVTINGRKLSKSSGPPPRVRDICLRYHPEAIRLFLLSTHYRRPIDVIERRLSESASALDRFYGFFQRLEGHVDLKNLGWGNMDSYPGQFVQEIDNDLNIAGGIAFLFASLRRFNRLMDGNGGYEGLTDVDKEGIRSILSICKNLLGIFADSPDQYLRKRNDYSRSNDFPRFDLEKKRRIDHRSRRIKTWRSLRFFD